MLLLRSCSRSAETRCLGPREAAQGPDGPESTIGGTPGWGRLSSCLLPFGLVSQVAPAMSRRGGHAVQHRRDWEGAYPSTSRSCWRPNGQRREARTRLASRVLTKKGRGPSRRQKNSHERLVVQASWVRLAEGLARAIDLARIQRRRKRTRSNVLARSDTKFGLGFVREISASTSHIYIDQIQCYIHDTVRIHVR